MGHNLIVGADQHGVDPTEVEVAIRPHTHLAQFAQRCHLIGPQTGLDLDDPLVVHVHSRRLDRTREVRITAEQQRDHTGQGTADPLDFRRFRGRASHRRK